MAANNYYGYSFNSAPSQYSTVTGSSGYATGAHAQHAIPVQSAYPPSQTTVQYGPYGTRSQVTSQAVQVQVYEEASPRYYTHAMPSAGSSADSYYSQKSKSRLPSSATYQSRPAYEQSYSTTSATPHKVTSSEWQVQSKPTHSQKYGSGFVTNENYSGTAGPSQTNAVTSAGSSQSYATGGQSLGESTSSTTASSASTSSYTGLDAAVYSAATNYLIQKQRGGAAGGNWFKNFKSGRGPPDPSQWKYCELCKCTCAGLQAYKAHLVGKAHKKKEAMAQSTAETKAGNTKGALGSHFYCQLCDVVCSSSDAYAAHMRGSKHQRILKLQIKMGKPIPTQESPVTAVLETAAAAAAATETKATAPPSAKILKTTSPSGVKKVYSTPKMTFIGGTQLKTTGVKMEEVTVKVEEEPQNSEDTSFYQSATDPDLDDKNAQPVGLEYIEESMNETRTAPNFYCKLCDCSFTDPHAKVMHTKGRRHRLQYKKKVDPSLKVDMKVTSYGSRAEMERVKRRIAAGEYWRKKEIQDSYKMEAEDLRYEKELLQWQLEKTAMRFDSMSTSAGPSSVVVPSGEKFRLVEMGSKRDAEHVNAKHVAVYPTEEDLKLVQDLVSTSERALKLVSDHLAATKIERDLKGVMRVGLLAKGLLLHDSLDFDLVVLCSCRPTRALLMEIMDHLPAQLETFTEEKFHLALTPYGTGFTLQHETESADQQNIICTISLTSPAVSPESGIDQRSEPDAFDVKPCLKSLAALRHAKWFQAKANTLFSCVTVIRIMMDFCKRVPTWSVVTQWSLELLVEKCISSDPAKLGPAIALRRVFEAVASGILLPGGPGVYDPCEKTPTDAFDYLTRQEREDLTNSAQHAVRLIAFGDIHKVLGMDPLPVPPMTSNNKANKRKHASS